MRIWMTGSERKELSVPTREILKEIHGDVEVLTAVVGREPRALLDYLAAADVADFVYADVTVMQALWAYALGRTFGLVDMEGDEEVGLYHVHDRIFDLVWEEGEVLLPGKPTDSLHLRWQWLDEGVERLRKLVSDGDEDS